MRRLKSTRLKSTPEVQERTQGGDQPTEIAAVRLLARREHSTKDLKRKLQGKGHAQDAVQRVVDKLVDKNLVCDERFAASFVRHHGRRGHGPIRIRAELRQQGATDDIIEAVLGRAEFDWGQVAADVRRRKFGEDPPRAMAERAKQTRFLQYRGFSGDQIRSAFQGSGPTRATGDEIQGPEDPDWID